MLLQYLLALVGVSLSRIGRALKWAGKTAWRHTPAICVVIWAGAAVQDYQEDSDLFYVDVGFLAVMLVCVGVQCACWLLQRRLERLRARRAQ